MHMHFPGARTQRPGRLPPVEAEINDAAANPTQVLGPIRRGEPLPSIALP
jgi:hypothetical protein